MKKMNKKARIYICAGLILNSAVFIAGESYHLPDFCNGLLRGLALGLMFMGLFFQRSSVGRSSSAGRSGCPRQASHSHATPENKQPE
jgi:hypothetical protein